MSVLAPGEFGYIFDVSQLCGSVVWSHVLWCGCAVLRCSVLCCAVGVVWCDVERQSAGVTREL